VNKCGEVEVKLHHDLSLQLMKVRRRLHTPTLLFRGSHCMGGGGAGEIRSRSGHSDFQVNGFPLPENKPGQFIPYRAPVPTELFRLLCRVYDMM
jgi:hypothetical protein